MSMTCVVNFDVEEIKADLVSRGFAVLYAAAAYCLAKAQEHCPVGTGELRDSGVILPDSDPGKVWVAFTARHAPFIEFGHYTRNQVSWVMPNPFLRFAVADAQIQWPQLVTSVWASTVDKGDGTHYYASRFQYSRPEFESQYTDLGYPTPGPSE